MYMQTSNTIKHTVQYYETDAMKIAHHANYVKWMEEARLAFLKSIGFDWKYAESTYGIMIPVLHTSVDYKYMLRFDEEVVIECKLVKYNGVKMEFAYTFSSKQGTVLNARGVTKHGFIDEDYKPIILSEKYDEGHSALMEALKP